MQPTFLTDRSIYPESCGWPLQSHEARWHPQSSGGLRRSSDAAFGWMKSSVSGKDCVWEWCIHTHTHTRSAIAVHPGAAHRNWARIQLTPWLRKIDFSAASLLTELRADESHDLVEEMGKYKNYRSEKYHKKKTDWWEMSPSLPLVVLEYPGLSLFVFHKTLKTSRGRGRDLDLYFSSDAIPGELNLKRHTELYAEV